MISIKKALEEIISDSPFLEDGIYNGYINFSSFANYIKPRIEQITKKKVTISSIKMGLTKYSKEKQKTITYKKFDVGDFYVKKDIEIIYMDKTNETLKLIKNIYDQEEALSKDNYLAVISGGKEISVIYDTKLSEKINSKISNKYIKLQLKSLSIIGIYFDEDCIYQNGLVYTLTKKLNFNNINMLELVSNFTEVAFLIQKKDLKKSFEVLLV